MLMLINSFGIMGTLPRLLVLLGLVGLVVSQEEIFRMIQQEPIWYEIGPDTVDVNCVWEQNTGVGQSQVVEWKANGAGISKATRNSTAGTYVYKNTPIPYERLNHKVDFDGYQDLDDPDLLKQSSTLQLFGFTVTDPRDYTCEVEIGREQRSTISQINPYAVPDVTMKDQWTEADLRPPVPEVPAEPETNSTAAVTVPTDDIGDKPDTDTADYDSNYDSMDDGSMQARRKRQLDSSDDSLPANFDITTPKIVTVVCRIVGAYPQPTNVQFIVGESETFPPGSPVIWIQDPGTKLFTAEAILALEAEPMYDGKSVSCTVDIPSVPVQTVSSSNTSTPFEILHEPDSVSTVISPMTANEGDNVLIECRGNGNPPPKFTVMSKNGPAAVEEADSPTHFTLSNIQRNQAGQYWCVASSADRANPDSTNTIESADKPYLDVRYIDPVQLSQEKVSATKGETVEVECTATGSPQPTVTWKKYGEIVQSGKSLRLANVDYSDSGVYECIAENPAGQRMKDIVVDVQGQCNIDFEKPFVTSSQEKQNAYTITLKCSTSGKPDCKVDIVAQSSFGIKGEDEEISPGVVETKYRSVPKLSAPVKFACVASNLHTPKYNKTVVVGEDTVACCDTPSKGGISTGAIVGILILVLVVVVGVPVACYLVKKRNAPPKKKAPADAEAGDGEKEGLHKEASSEDSDTGSLPPPPADTDNDHRMNSSHEMTTFSTNN